MTKLTSTRWKALGTAVCMAATLCTARAAPPRGEVVARNGNGAGAPPCVACHGVAGQGQPAAGVPRLAGMSAAYLSKQLRELRDGGRSNAVMGPIAKTLDDADVTALGTYYASLKVVDDPVAPTADPATVSAGRIVALKGRWTRGLPGCAQCHGAQGLGMGDSFPRLAGQSAPYLANQLESWRSGMRTNDPLHLMQGIAAKLSPQDIQEVANYYASLSPVPGAATGAVAMVGAAPRAAEQEAAPSAVATAKEVAKPAPGRSSFSPPDDGAIPATPFGDQVRLGQAIFSDTRRHAGTFVGNDLRCANCHLDGGRLANASPLWGAYVAYPAYRSKNGHVNTLAERMQGCFRYSMNGKAPPLGDKVLVALETYAYFLAKGAPVGEALEGRGYPTPAKPPLQMDFARGAKVFEEKCSLCHGGEGQGRMAHGDVVFPPLWGPRSFNWGAGMSSIKNAAGFVKANMPLGQGNTLTDQEAWDVALFMDSHERPQDPRFLHSTAETKARYHDSGDMYGETVDGVRLGVAPLKKAR